MVCRNNDYPLNMGEKLTISSIAAASKEKCMTACADYRGPILCNAFAHTWDGSVCHFYAKFDVKAAVWLWGPAAGGNTGGGVDFCYAPPLNHSAKGTYASTGASGMDSPLCNGTPDPPQCTSKFASVECKQQEVRTECPVLCKSCFEVSPLASFQCQNAWPTASFGARWSAYCLDPASAFWAMSSNCQIAWPAATAEAAVRECKSLDATCVLFDANKTKCVTLPSATAPARPDPVTTRNATSAGRRNATTNVRPTAIGTTRLFATAAVPTTTGNRDTTNAQNDANGGSDTSTGLVLGIVLPFVALTMVLVVLLVRRHRRHRTNNLKQGERGRRPSDDGGRRHRANPRARPTSSAAAGQEYGSVTVVGRARATAPSATAYAGPDQTVYTGREAIATVYTSSDTQNACA